MKKAIKAPLSQVIWSRIYILTSLISSILLSMWVVSYFFVFEKGDFRIGIIALVMCALLLGSGVFVSISYWKHAWSKIIIENNTISLSCIFAKRISLNIEDIKRVSVKNDGKEPFALLTTNKSLPFLDAEKIESKEGLIKFYLTDELKDILLELLPMSLTKSIRKIK